MLQQSLFQMDAFCKRNHYMLVDCTAEIQKLYSQLAGILVSCTPYIKDRDVPKIEQGILARQYMRRHILAEQGFFRARNVDYSIYIQGELWVK